MSPLKKDYTIYTIGHSNKPIEILLGKLLDNKITKIIDVRSIPYSRYNPQFNKNSLKESLKKSNIGYEWQGEILGGKTNPTLETYTEIEKICKAVKKDGVKNPDNESRLCFICSEEDPSKCHRHWIIAQYIEYRIKRIKIKHIRLKENIPNQVESSPLKFTKKHREYFNDSLMSLGMLFNPNKLLQDVFPQLSIDSFGQLKTDGTLSIEVNETGNK